MAKIARESFAITRRERARNGWQKKSERNNVENANSHRIAVKNGLEFYVNVTRKAFYPRIAVSHFIVMQFDIFQAEYLNSL
jgi:hypothetical protein